MMRSLFRLITLLMVLRFSQGLTSSKYLKLMPNSEPVYISNTQVLLTCELSPSESLSKDAKLFWIDENGKRIKSEEKGTFLSLMFNDQSLKEGNYTCQYIKFYNGEEKVIDAISVLVKFAKEPNFEKCVSQQYLIKGESKAKIKCAVESVPLPVIEWTKNNALLKNDEYVVSNDGIEILSPVDDRHSGVYTMDLSIRENGIYIQKNISVIIVEKPKILEIKSDLPYIIEGKQTKISCVGEPNQRPHPRYYWLDAAKRNISELNNLNYEVNVDTGDLIIKTGSSNDEGNFTCIAENDFGREERQIEIKYAAKPEFNFDASQAESNNEIKVLLGNKAELVCEIKLSDLPVNLTIRKQAESSDYVDENRVQTLINNDTDKYVITGTIPSTRKDDSGVYECVAENIGGVIKRQMKLDIVYAPFIKQIKPVKIYGEMKAVNLTCEIDANPNGTVQWFINNNQEIPETTDTASPYRIYHNNHGSLLEVRRGNGVPFVQNTYQCVVTNKVLGAQERRSVDIKVEEAFPPSPVIVMLKEKGIKQRQLTFIVDKSVRDNGLPIKGYVVKLFDTNFVDNEIVSEAHPSNKNDEIVLNDLKPNTKYNIRTAARNDAGVGEYGPEVIVSTLAETVPESPQFTHGNAFDSITGGDISSAYTDEYTVSWSQPEDNGAQITAYDIKYFRVVRKLDNNEFEKVGDMKEAIVNGNDGLIYRLTSLDAESYYKVEIQARNVHGASKMNYMIFRTAKGVGTSEDNIETRPSTSYSIVALVSLILVIILILAIIVDIVISINCGIGISHYLCPQLFQSGSMAVKGDDNNTNTNHHTVLNEEQAPMMDKSSDANTKFHKDSAV